jgi:predicted DNA-binding helix-hairpin-helix protein
MYQNGLVKGLFLSSAVDRNPFRTMEDMIKVIEILRYKSHFPGYIHLKILPESTTDYIETAVRLATRVSINIEAPSPVYLKKIAPQKNFNLIWNKFLHLRELSRRGLAARAGFTTQLVVGGSEESDLSIMKTVCTLYQDFSMARAYYSAFHPISGTPLAEKQPESTWREHRLYQADFLFRKYGFHLNELIFNPNGNLPLEVDPKTLWATSHPEYFPIEINTASYQQLIRVPGIGPISAKRIIQYRKENHFRDLRSLQNLGIHAQVAAPYILLSGKYFRVPQQLSLFPENIAG